MMAGMGSAAPHAFGPGGGSSGGMMGAPGGLGSVPMPTAPLGGMGNGSPSMEALAGSGSPSMEGLSALADEQGGGVNMPGLGGGVGGGPGAFPLLSGLPQHK